MVMGMKDVSYEAIKWFVRWSDQSEISGTKEQSRWIAWLQRSPKEVSEYFAIDDLCARLGESRMLKELDVDAWLARGRAEVVPLTSPRPHPLSISEGRGEEKPWNRWLWSAAATAALLIGTATFWQLRGLANSYHTGIGQQMTVRLSDGSSLQLNTRSRAEVKFDEKMREIDLKGEALFTVAPGSARPFLVRTHDATIQALGTRFNVYEEDGATRVTVLEGQVRVTPRKLEEKSFDLSAGEAAHVNRSAAKKDAKPDIKAATAWRNHTLVFERTRLADVAKEFNRYNTRQVQVDPSIDDSYRLSGTFDAEHPESLLLWLQSRPDLEVQHDGLNYKVRESVPHGG